MIFIDSDGLKDTVYVVCLNNVEFKGIVHCKKGETYKCKIKTDYKDNKTNKIYNALKILCNEKCCSHIIALREDFKWDLDEWFSKYFKLCENKTM